MPDYLSVKEWETLKAKPKNLGLKAQKTGITEKLKAVNGAKQNFEKLRAVDTATNYIVALTNLASTAGEQSKKHPLFKEATDYLKEIVKSANSRKNLIEKEKDRIESAVKKLNELKVTVGKAINVIPSIDSPKKFAAFKPVAVELMAAGLFKSVSSGTLAKLNNRCMVESSLTAVTEGNLTEKKKEVLTLLGELKNQLATAKVSEMTKHDTKEGGG